ncbi:hypothetical protein BTVI_146295 [Pitangus sulphuratus]|nr:hypothetical protein BTVI_146295 [Pitangus sulphuratus]
MPSRRTCTSSQNRHLMRFHKAKYRVSHAGRGNAKQEYRRGEELIESSPGEKDLGVLVCERLDIIWPCALTAQKAKCVLSCTQSSMASRSDEEILSLCSPLVRPHLEHCIQLWSLQHRKGTNPLEQVQRRAMIKGLEHLFL